MRTTRKTTSQGIRSGRVALVLHLYYSDLWPEFRQRVVNVRNAIGADNVDLFVTLTPHDRSREMRSVIGESFPQASVEIVPNRGLDVGPFLLCWRKICCDDSTRRYEYLLKLHSKKSLHSIGAARGAVWRGCLADAIAGSVESVSECLRLLEDGKTGMVGHDNSLSVFDFHVEPYVRKLTGWLGLRGDKFRYVKGTMFWTKMSILRRFFTRSVVDGLYRRMDGGYAADGTAAHGLERLFGHMVYSMGFELTGVAPQVRPITSRAHDDPFRWCRIPPPNNSVVGQTSTRAFDTACAH